VAALEDSGIGLALSMRLQIVTKRQLQKVILIGIQSVDESDST